MLQLPSLSLSALPSDRTTVLFVLSRLNDATTGRLSGAELLLLSLAPSRTGWTIDDGVDNVI